MLAQCGGPTAGAPHDGDEVALEVLVVEVEDGGEGRHVVVAEHERRLVPQPPLLAHHRHVPAEDLLVAPEREVHANDRATHPEAGTVVVEVDGVAFGEQRRHRASVVLGHRPHLRIGGQRGTRLPATHRPVAHPERRRHIAHPQPRFPAGPGQQPPHPHRREPPGEVVVGRRRCHHRTIGRRARTHERPVTARMTPTVRGR